MGLKFKYFLQKHRRAALLTYLQLTDKRLLRNTRNIQFLKLHDQFNYIYCLFYNLLVTAKVPKADLHIYSCVPS